jgi:hypothetical protein
VFYLLPCDLGLRYERGGDRLGALVPASPEVLDVMVPSCGGELATAAAAPLVDGGVLLLRRELATDVGPSVTQEDDTCDR